MISCYYDFTLEIEMASRVRGVFKTITNRIRLDYSGLGWHLEKGLALFQRLFFFSFLFLNRMYGRSQRLSFRYFVGVVIYSRWKDHVLGSVISYYLVTVVDGRGILDDSGIAESYETWWRVKRLNLCDRRLDRPAAAGLQV